jgi:branched-chain amino acid transport system ATP-binding protein
MLKVQSISTYYGDKPALHGVSLDIKKNEIVSLLGANGAGKTTLLKSISGILKPKSGNIYFLDQSIDKKHPWKIVELGIIQVPEGRQLFPEMTVYENMLMGALTKKKSNFELNSDMERIFELFPILKKRIRQKAGSLSGGEGQMLAIARGLMSNPKLLLLDEPSQGLSPILIKQLAELFAQIRDNGITIMLVEQNIIIPRATADTVYLMESGIIKEKGPKEEIFEKDVVRKIYLGASLH